MDNLKLMLKGNWDEVKGKIQKKWGELTDDDLEKINGSYRQLVGKIQKTYGLKMSEAEAELIEFFNTTDFDRLKKEAMQKIESIKDVVMDTLGEYAQDFKDKSLSTEKAISNFAKENPFKLIGIAAVAGIITGWVFCGSKK